jgi:hypothetical protein
MELPLRPQGHHWAIGPLWPCRVGGPFIGGICNTPMAQTPGLGNGRGDRTVILTPPRLSPFESPRVITDCHNRTSTAHHLGNGPPERDSLPSGCPVERRGVELALAMPTPASDLRLGGEVCIP